MKILQLIDSLRHVVILQWGYWGLRLAMVLTFVISGVRKMPGILFTTLPDTNPVGAYFKAMHETGFYWHAIGYFQILIGLLVFFNRFVVVSSLLMMPVTVNIFLISISLHMTGTPVITSMMLLGNMVLILWHHENYISLIRKQIYKIKENKM